MGPSPPPLPLHPLAALHVLLCALTPTAPADKLIHYLNLDGRVNAFYSTPSIYTDAKLSVGKAYTLKTDDFFRE